MEQSIRLGMDPVIIWYFPRPQRRAKLLKVIQPATASGKVRKAPSVRAQLLSSVRCFLTCTSSEGGKFLVERLRSRKICKRCYCETQTHLLRQPCSTLKSEKSGTKEPLGELGPCIGVLESDVEDLICVRIVVKKETKIQTPCPRLFWPWKVEQHF